MDFTVTEHQRELRELARRVTGGSQAAASGPTWPAVWQNLVAADLVGVALPDELGGLGFGPVELCEVATAVGAAGVATPLAWTAATAASLAQFGGPEERQLAAQTARTGLILTVAADPDTETEVRGERQADGWRLNGTIPCVPWAGQAAGILVPVQTDDGVAAVLVRPGTEGVELVGQTTRTGEPWSDVVLRSVLIGQMLGEPGKGAQVIAAARHLLVVLLCAAQVGVTETALRMTAEHLGTRRQFGRPLGAFQAVAARAADAYIDLEALRVTTLQAAWALQQGRPAEREILVAKFWAAEAGHRVASAAQHLHGGLGVDTDYPLHRYFFLAKQQETQLGGVARQLHRLGTLFARDDDWKGF